MKRKFFHLSLFTAACLVLWAVLALGAEDKYFVKVPGGLAFAEFRGYETWETISISRSEKAVGAIVGNPAMIDAYKSGVPGNGKPFPEGAKMAKIHWAPKQNEHFKEATIPGELVNVDFMVKDSKGLPATADGDTRFSITTPRPISLLPAP